MCCFARSVSVCVVAYMFLGSSWLTKSFSFFACLCLLEITLPLYLWRSGEFWSAKDIGHATDIRLLLSWFLRSFGEIIVNFWTRAVHRQALTLLIFFYHGRRAALRTCILNTKVVSRVYVAVDQKS